MFSLIFVSSLHNTISLFFERFLIELRASSIFFPEIKNIEVMFSANAFSINKSAFFLFFGTKPKKIKVLIASPESCKLGIIEFEPGTDVINMSLSIKFFTRL